MRNSCCAKLHVFSFGFALGIVWGVAMLITGLVAWGTGYGAGFVETMRTIYIGYDATLPGSFIGGAWGFADMFLMGVIIAGLYNLFLLASCKDKCACMTTTATHHIKRKNKSREKITE